MGMWPSKPCPKPHAAPPPRPRVPPRAPHFGFHYWHSQWKVPPKPQPARSRMAPYFEVLGLPVTSSFEEVKRAYRRLALKHHPDKKRSLDDEGVRISGELFCTVAEPYEK